jgi:hypothetical protein
MGLAQRTANLPGFADADARAEPERAFKVLLYRARSLAEPPEIGASG